MIPARFFSVSIFLALLLTLAGAAGAGQVVTQDIRDQAKKLILAEKALGTVTAKNTLAVLYFRNRSGLEDLDPLRKGLALMLTTDLSTVQDLQVVERVRLQALVEELGLGSSGIVEQGTAPRVGKLLGARWLVGGDINGGQQNLRVQSDILEVPADRVLGRPVSEGQLEELFRVEKDLLFEILKLVKIDVTPDEKARLMKPCSTRWSALLYLFKGVDASDRGEYQTAAELYEKALREDPQICLAGDALTELHTLGLSPAKKKSVELLRSLRNGTSLTNELTPKEELRNEITPKDLLRKDFNRPTGP
jgi:TolB-like protein